jgi:hypothetical protein
MELHCAPVVWPIIQVACETKIGKVKVQDQPWQAVHKIPSPKQPEQNGLKLCLK